MTEWRDGSLRSYLLGHLPEEEAGALEEAYLGDPELLARVRGAEDDLLDDYAAERLTAPDRRAFEARYLGSPPLRRRVEAARALRLQPRRVEPRPLRAMGGRRIPLVPLALAAAVLLAVIGFTWTRWGAGQRPGAPAVPEARLGVPTPTPSLPPRASPTAGPTPRAGSPPPGQLSRLVFALSPTLLRGGGRTTEVRVPPGSTDVTIELRGDPAGGPGHGALGATLETVEGAVVWSGAAQRRTAPGLAAAVVIPAERLRPGDYLVTLTVAGAARHRYFFRVLPVA